MNVTLQEIAQRSTHKDLEDFLNYFDLGVPNNGCTKTP